MEPLDQYLAQASEQKRRNAIRDFGLSIRDMVGATSGLKAAAGTIRGDFSSSRQMNLVHASDSPESAEREIALYFQPEEVLEHTATLTPWLRADDE